MKINIAQIKKLPNKIIYPLLISWAVLLIVFVIDTGNNLISQYHLKKTSTQADSIRGIRTSTPPPSIPTPTPTNTPTSTPFPKKATISSDPVITCNATSDSNCSGQNIQIKQSVCSNIVCCQVGNKWTVYPSKEQCVQAQSQNTTNQNKLVQGVWENVKENAKNSGYSVCILGAKQNVDQCGKECNYKNTYYKEACDAGYSGLGWDSSRYSECLEETSDIYSNCQNQCNSNYLAASKKCSDDAGYK